MSLYEKKPTSDVVNVIKEKKSNRKTFRNHCFVVLRWDPLLN